MNFAARINLRPLGRRSPAPVWAIVIVALWLTLIAVFVIFAPSSADDFTLCHFKRFTGVPCPTCGTTRAAIAISHGRFAEAMALNPLMAALAAGCAAWLILRLGFGLRIQVQLTRRERAAVWLAVAAALGANWAYLVLTGR